MAHEVQIRTLDSVPLAVVRRQASQAELASLVPSCCGLVWEAVRSQQVKAGRHVALYWDGSIRLEVGVADTTTSPSSMNGPCSSTPTSSRMLPSQ